LPSPTTQSVTFAPVANGPSELESRTRQGSGVPRTLSSVKLVGVPLSSNAPLMSSRSDALPPAQASWSLG
jgi:hypothetical protein